MTDLKSDLFCSIYKLHNAVQLIIINNNNNNNNYNNNNNNNNNNATVYLLSFMT